MLVVPMAESSVERARTDDAHRLTTAAPATTLGKGGCCAGCSGKQRVYSAVKDFFFGYGGGEAGKRAGRLGFQFGSGGVTVRFESLFETGLKRYQNLSVVFEV